MAVEEAEAALAAAAEAWARHDVEGIVAHLSAAVRALTAAGDARGAAMACARLGDAYANGLGNLVAGRAWFARAARLVAAEPPCLEQGYVAVAAMGCDVGDPDTLLANADLALDRARRFGDVNLEAKALADGGLAHVQAGRVAEGMARLDEAMALTCGPADDAEVAGKSVCSFFTACYYAADFARAGSWADLLRRRGLIGLEAIAPVFLSSHCDSVQATLLCELGRWGEAEALLVRADADFEAVVGLPSWHPAIVLADLRVRQGRLAEAEALLIGKDQGLDALLPAARLHLARGDLALARAAANRGIRCLGRDRLRAVELLAVLVEVELASGAVDEAEQACADLVARTGDLAVPALQARTAVARARVVAASTGTGAGAHREGAAAALPELEAALDRLGSALPPWQRAVSLVELARLRERAGDAAGAAVDAGAAAALLAGLDVVVPADHRAFLDRLAPGVLPVVPPPATPSDPAAAAPVVVAEAPAPRPSSPVAPAAVVATLARDGRWWVAEHGGTRVRLQSTKGLQYLAELVANPGVERHALDLVDRVEGVDPAGPDRRALGDAGPLLDRRARASYRHRIEDLRGEAEDALVAGDHDRAEAAQAELDQLVGQLAAAFGLGGRERRASAAAERARLNVTRALRTALTRLADALPGPGDALDRGVRTGLFCAYEPAAGEPVRWIVQRAVNGARPD